MVVSSTPIEVHEEPRESSPLLPTSSREASPVRHAPHPLYIRVTTIICISIFLIEIGDYLMRAPSMRMMEDIICSHYYRSHDPTRYSLSIPIPEADCKIPPVQAEVAFLRGWDVTLSSLPSILLAVPYGTLADKYGRKVVTILSLTGVMLNLLWVMFTFSLSEVISLRWIWLGDAFFLIGGGTAVLKSMLYAMVADVVTENQRAAVFFRVNALALASTVIGVPLASHMMKKNYIVPMWLGIGFIALGIPCTLWLPETLEKRVTPYPDSDSDTEYGEDQESLPETRNTSLGHQILTFLTKTKGKHFMLQSPMLMALSLTFIIQSLSGRSTEFLYQLASERFHWKLADASFLIPIGAITNFIVLIVALPLISRHLTKNLKLSSMICDLIISRGSLVVLIFGSLAIAWAPLPRFYILGTIIFSCGAGFSPALRSLVTSLVHPHQVSRLYAVMAIIDVLGQMVYSPILSKGFGWGANLGGQWTGMAFIFCAILFAVAGFPVWLVRKPTRDMDVHG
ncbi:major facilitator superfamily domain-containing protein [Bisporella sp. PMI_857]|nr:major facilitator superfamily domain-containing protein [Bisporella sp. PMI_857]